MFSRDIFAIMLSIVKLISVSHKSLKHQFATTAREIVLDVKVVLLLFVHVKRVAAIMLWLPLLLLIVDYYLDTNPRHEKIVSLCEDIKNEIEHRHTTLS